MRIAVDTGGTFTDLVVEDEDGGLTAVKRPSTPEDVIDGVLDAIDAAARELSRPREELLRDVDSVVYGTTTGLNAILTGGTAKTALLTTQGHPDVLLFREGGRQRAFDFTQEYPAPYVPSELTFEVPERVGAQGEIVQALEESAVKTICRELERREIEAVAVTFLWSIANPAHELRVGEILAAALPGVPYTLSHQLNPTIREYRRASSTAIDASLKPVMRGHLSTLAERLEAAGFGGRLLVVTSSGGVLDASEVAAAPIHSVRSGPAMAPVAGREYAGGEGESGTAVITDAGGTSYEVSVVRRGRIPITRDTWLGPIYRGHITGFASVDVKSIGAGGGSIASVDDFGLLRVGPQSAGADPGPVCYARGGREPTVTDAAVVLGYIDPENFLGGRMELDAEAARESIRSRIGVHLGLDAEEAAGAILDLATERMARAIEEITLNQGIDPSAAVLVGGGGSAGINVVGIARRLGFPEIVMPDLGPVLSAAGALISDLSADYATTFHTDTEAFDLAGANAALAGLRERCERFIREAGGGAVETAIEYSVEARYMRQVWELDVPLVKGGFDGEVDVAKLASDFHRIHEEVFATKDPGEAIEIVAWKGRARCRLRESSAALDAAPRKREERGGRDERAVSERMVHFGRSGPRVTPVFPIERIGAGERIDGPAIVESEISTIVLDPGARLERKEPGSIRIVPGAEPREGRMKMSAGSRRVEASDE